MRYVITFVLGVAVGAASIILLTPRPREEPPPTAASPKTPAPSLPVKSEEEILAARVGMQISPAGTRAEMSVAGPQMKPTPPLESPAELTPDSIIIPVVDVTREELRDTFRERRGDHQHNAIDIPAPRGTAVVAAIDGSVGKLFLSKPGGMTIYQYDPAKAYIYYYAHLDGYAPGLAEGQQLRRGEVIGFVGTSGNAPPNAPHLHFAIERVTEPGHWWKSEPIDPYPLLASRGVTMHRASPAR